jgi:transposase InsO family protein
MRQMGRSEHRACELANLSRSTYRYQPSRRSDEPMRTRLKELARRHLSYGTPRLTALLRREFARSITNGLSGSTARKPCSYRVARRRAVAAQRLGNRWWCRHVPVSAGRWTL